MKYITSPVVICCAVFIAALFSVVQVHAAPDFSWAKKVGARKSPSKKSFFLVNNYGAVNDGKTLATPFIQKAMDECAKKGGGIVSFKPGLLNRLYLS